MGVHVSSLYAIASTSHCTSQPCARVLPQLFQNTASALPAELGPDGEMLASPRPGPGRRMALASPSRAARAWAKRLAAGRRRRQVGTRPRLPSADVQRGLERGFFSMLIMSVSLEPAGSVFQPHV